MSVVAVFLVLKTIRTVIVIVFHFLLHSDIIFTGKFIKQIPDTLLAWYLTFVKTVEGE